MSIATLVQTLDTPPAATAATATADARVVDAIVAAVRQRLGADATVIVDALISFNGDPSSTIEAVPDPGARLGDRIGFTLLTPRLSRGGVSVVRVGHATARLRVTVDYVRARRFLPRGAEISASEVEAARGEVTGLLLKRLPVVAEIVGARVLRDLAPGAYITAVSINATPAVRTGDEVLAVSRVASVEASTTMVAAESGAVGTVIRVVNRQSRKTIRARVMSTGVVEIIEIINHQ